MARFPGAIWRPLDARYVPSSKITTHNRVNLHVAVSESASLHGFFNQPGRASSHFYVRKDGTVEQYIDTTYRGEADLDGNDATISVETQGGLKDANGEPWTPEQVEALARLYAWAVTEHGVPQRIATDSKVGSSSHGLSWHRLGVDGNFPALPDVRAGRTQRGGGMRYSTSRGKACPGDTKIRQIPEIFARAVQILTPPTQEDPDMLVIRRGTGSDPNRRYALVSGGRAREISRTTYVRLRKVGHGAVQFENADYDGLVKGWK